MTRKAFSLVSLLLIAGMLLTPFGGAQRVAAADEPPASGPMAHAREVPQEIRDLFEGGMSVDEFIQLNGGQIPRALEEVVKEAPTVHVIVEMEQAPVTVYQNSVEGKAPVDVEAYLSRLQSMHALVAPRIQKLGGQVLFDMYYAYNGFQIAIPVDKVAELMSLPYVKAVHPVHIHTIALGASVPLIGAPAAWAAGYDGTGVKVAVIDTGIDYTHAVFGGPGDPAVYAADDHTVITDTLSPFPTTKVITGTDFAGTDYDAGDPDHDTPHPDPDPIDEHGHGTHVASTIAGIKAGDVMTGVAYGASLIALKVFGAEGSTDLVVPALDWVARYNLDNPSDPIDVINMSLGADFGPNDPADPEIIAVNNLAAADVVVVVAAGNAGNTAYILGTPAAADGALAVAASTTGWATGPTIDVVGSTYITQTNILYQPPAFDGDTGHYTETVTATLAYVGNIPGIADDELCDISAISTTTELQGKIALIQRGSCAFTTKVNNAAQLGAIGAIIFNHSSGGDALVTMAGDPVNIPAGFIGHTNGLDLAQAHGQTVVVHAESEVKTVRSPIPPDTIADFSSRGPRGFDSGLKPEIDGPGVAIFAAKMGSGTGGVSMNGTSMATPHVAGAAALMRQAHPGWTGEQIKAGLINTAVDMYDGTPIPRAGAGRVSVPPAVASPLVAVGDPLLTTLSWGYVEVDTNPQVMTKTVTIYNTGSSPAILTATAEFQPPASTDGIQVEVLPSTFTIMPGGSATAIVSMTLNGPDIDYEFGQVESYGYAIFHESSSGHELRVPFYIVPRPYSYLTEASLDQTIDSVGDTFDVTYVNTGTAASSLWPYPLFISETVDSTVGDEADVHYFGMDYGWTSPAYGPIVVPAINVWGKWHTPQPYFAEFDLYLDTDMDGYFDIVDFNWNYGAVSSGADDNLWVVIQYDMSDGNLYLASPYLIYTDYNAGFMEWYLPTAWNGITGPMDYALRAFDYDGNYKTMVGPGSFDYRHPPLTFASDYSSIVLGAIDDPAGYGLSKPIGFMVVDYNGKPGIAQAHGYELEIANDAAVHKSGPALGVISDTLTYNIDYAIQSGDNETTTITLVDTLPEGTAYVTDTSGVPPVINGRTITWTFADVQATGAFAFQLTAFVSDTVAGGTVLTNTVSITSTLPDDTDTTNNTAVVTTTVFPEVSIHDIQYVPDPGSSDTSPYSGQTVWVEGIVTAKTGELGYPNQGKLVIEEPDGGPWSGLLVYGVPGFATQEGDYVRLLAPITEYYGMTEMSFAGATYTYTEIISHGNTLPAPEVITTGIAADANLAEPYENVLVEAQNVTVTDDNLGYGEWSINDGSGDMRVDDDGDHDGNLTYSPNNGDRFNFVRGIFQYTYSNYKIEPRYDPDLDKVTQANVQFVYHDAEDVISSGTDLYLAGSFNSWSPSALVMDHDAAYEVFTVTVPITEGTAIEYKYVVGGSEWDWVNTNNRTYTVPNSIGIEPVTYTLSDYRNVEVGWQVLHPTVAEISVGESTGVFTGEFYIQNVTNYNSNAPGPGLQLQAEFGYGTSSDISAWTWMTATYAGDSGNNDLYTGIFTPTAGGTYSYTVCINGNWGAGNPNSARTCATVDSSDFTVSKAGSIDVFSKVYLPLIFKNH